MPGTPFRLGLTRDLLTPSGAPSFGMGALEVLNSQPNIEWEYLPESLTEITPDVAARYDGLYVNSPQVTAASVARADCRARIVARLEKPDHRAFAASELDAAAQRAGAECVVTSRKDFVKLDRAPAVAVVVPELEVAFIEGEERVRAALAACVSARGARSSA
jgi:hypothetical protein